MMRSLSARILIIAAFAAMILVNYLANALPINGVTPADVSDRYPTLFTPAGFTFCIWGVIYAALLGFVVFQALPSQKNNAFITKITPLILVNFVANAAWIFAFHYDVIWLSVVIIFVILSTLILIYRTLRDNRSPTNILERIFLYLPFSLYTAWIVVATLANLTIMQSVLGMADAGMSETAWTVGKIALAGAIVASIVWRTYDLPFILVIAWAAYGISSKQADTPIIAGAALTVCILCMMLAVIVGTKRIFGKV